MPQNPYSGVPFGMQNQGSAKSSSKTTFLDKGLLQSLMKMFGGMMGQTSGGYANFVNDPTSSPAFQNSLSGLLAALQPQETASRNALTDQFRASGGLRGSAFGQSASNLEGDIMRNQQVTASDLLAKMYPEIANAMFAPMGQLASLLSGAKGTTSEGAASGSGSGGGGLQRAGPIQNYTPMWGGGGQF